MGHQNHRKRKLRNFFINPNFQLKYAFYFAGTSVAVLGIIYALISQRINRLANVMSSMELDVPSTQAEMSRLLVDISFITLGAYLVNILICLTISVVLTHRVAGPAMKIQRLLRQLINGEYGTQSSIRKNDDLQAVMSDVNELSRVLKQKHN